MSTGNGTATENIKNSAEQVEAVIGQKHKATKLIDTGVKASAKNDIVDSDIIEQVETEYDFKIVKNF